jgi:LemA protein
MHFAKWHMGRTYMTFLAIILGLFILAYFWYANIISKRNKALEALSGIDVQLKQRLDLIPNILKIAQKFMDHERGLLEDITKLRTRASADYNPKDKSAVTEHLAIAEQLSGKMGQLMISVENYPTLKSDATMVQAMQTYSEAEANVAAARRFYNASVTALNNAIQIFPGNLIASMAGVTDLPFFKAEEAVHAPVNADDYLK